MNIAIFTDIYLEVPGGIPSSIRAQKTALESLGHKVTIFCPGHHTTEENVILVPTCKKFKINGAPMGKNPGVVESWIVENVPNFQDFDIIHSHYEAEVSIAGMRLAKLYHIPLVQTMHGREDMAISINVPHPFKTIVAYALSAAHSRYIPHAISVPLDDYLAPTVARAKMWGLMVNHANFADTVITPSKHMAKKLKNYGVKQPIYTVSNGVPDNLVAKNWKVRTLKPGEPLQLLWGSRASHEKRILPFLEALTQINFPYKLHVYGNGNEQKRAEAYAKKHQLNVQFYGLTPPSKILSNMNKYHLSVMASLGFDTQGLTLLEAEATGLPVIFCDPDMKEVVPTTGSIYAAGGESKDFATALIELYSHPARIEKMSTVMLEHQKDALQSTQVKNLLSVYQKTVENHHKKSLK